MRHLILLSLFLVALSGCVDDAPEADEPVPVEEPESDVDDGKLGYVVDEESANETELEGAHLHDEWGASEELVLMDGRVETADCANPFTTLALLGFGLFTQQEVQVGCASWRFDEEVIVPEGTESLRVEVDATDALDAGGMKLSYGNDEQNFTTLEATTDPVYTWEVPMDPVEWDLPHSTHSTWFFMLRPDGSPSVLDGAVEVFVVANRLPDWEPILGSAHIDHWAEDANHDFIGEGVYRALDTNTTIVMSSFADRVTTQDGGFDGAGLADIVAPGATEVTLFVQWGDVQNCPAVHECWIVPFMGQSGGRGFSFQSPVEEGEDWALYTYAVPDQLQPESTYATRSDYTVNAFVRACPNGEPQQTPIPFFNGCMGEAVATMEAETRIEVEVWNTPADLAAVKARMGVA